MMGIQSLNSNGFIGKKKNIAVVGTGYWGKNHVRNFYELGALRSVCDISPITLKKITQTYRGILHTSEFEEVLSDSEIQGIVIATQAETHYDLALLALNSGKDVLVEKPLALTVRQARHLHKVAIRNDRILMVGHLLLYHPAISKMKAFITHGELGDIYYLYSHRLNLGKVRHEENILWSFAPHDISVILEFLEEKPVFLQSIGEAYLQSQIHDVTMTTMKFKSGAMAHIHVSWLHPFKEHRIVIVGSEKMMVFQDTVQENRLLLYDQRVDIVNGIPQVVQRDGVRIEFSTEEPLKRECMHFLESIETRKQPKSDGQNGIDVLEVLEWAQQELDTSN